MQRVRSGGQAARGRQPGGKTVTKRRGTLIRFNRGSCDYSLVFMVIFLVLFGVVMLYSATIYTDTFFRKQAVFALGGVVLMMAVSRLDYTIYKRLSPVIIVFSLILMALLVISSISVSKNNSSRWLEIGGISFQPAEIFKISVIIFNATLLNKLGRKIGDFKITMIYFVLAALEGMAVLVLADNLSTAIIVVVVAVCMMLVSRPNKLACFIVFSFTLVAVLSVILYFKQLDVSHEVFDKMDFRLKRVMRWLQPDKYSYDGGNYQTLQSVYAIGSGSFIGKGIGNSTQNLIVPEAMNDMIFAIVCEELGFVGATFLLVLYGLLMQRLVFIARNAKDFYGSLVAVGIMSHIGTQVVLNVAVATNSMPNTGVTLPFFSYGGTALTILLAEMGVALSVSRHISLE